MANPGDTVKINTEKETVEGILIPTPSDSSVFVKLSSGYNRGINKKSIKSIEVVKKAPAEKKTKKELKAKNNAKKIVILHTGGTIASKVDYRTGGVVTAFTPSELIELFPELNEIASISSKLVSNMWSDDLRFAHFEKIAKAIEQEVKNKADGIIIGIGTDNLAVAAAALAFIVESTPIPIILVGAQRSSDRGSSDAAMNLICAAEFIAKASFQGVAICMHHRSGDDSCAILPPTKTKKLHTSRRDAFRPVNDEEIALINYKTRKITELKKAKHSTELILKPKMEEKVALIKVHINMNKDQFEAFQGYKGLIIEGTGLGHTPGHTPDDVSIPNKKIFPAIKKLVDAGTIVVMTSNCTYGRVNLDVYDKGRDLKKLGVLSGEDMLAETALVKLSWLLANHNKKEAEENISKNLRGEINDRLQLQDLGIENN